MTELKEKMHECFTVRVTTGEGEETVGTALQWKLDIRSSSLLITCDIIPMLFLSAFFHLMLMSVILYFAAPIAFDAAFPSDPVRYFLALAALIAASLSMGSILGLAVRNQAKLTMVSQLIFLLLRRLRAE